MKRRSFLKSLGAIGFAPLLPGTTFAVAATRPEISSASYMWAETIVRAHRNCSTAMLQRHLGINAAAANAIQSQLVRNGVVSARANAYGLRAATNPLSEGAYLKPSNSSFSAEPAKKVVTTEKKCPLCDDLSAFEVALEEGNTYLVEPDLSFA